MLVKPPLAKLDIKTGEGGFYHGFTKDVTITATHGLPTTHDEINVTE